MDLSTRLPRRRARWHPLGLCLFALAFGLALAVLRPPFQISDEVAYFASVQVSLAESTRVAAPGPCARLAEPVTYAVAARPVFAAVTVPVLQGMCRATQSPTLAFIAARAVLSLSLVALTLATVLAGRRLLPAEPAIGWLAGVLVATHAVLASYQAAFTPDALANLGAGLGSALLIVALTARRLAPRVGWAAAAVAVVCVAALAKDTAAGLAAVMVVAAPFAVADAPGRSTAARRALWALAMVAVAVGLLLVWWYGGQLLARRLAAATPDATGGVDVGAVLRAGAASLVPYFVSMTLEAGNFGGLSVPLPRVILFLWAGAIAFASGGLARVIHRGPPWMPHRRAFLWLGVIFGLALCATLLQAPLRNVLIARAPAVQGRWLFPLAVPLAVWIAIGLRAWLPAPRFVPLATVLAVGGAWVALFWTLLPHYYTEFPTTVSRAHLFLKSAYGGPVDAAGVDAFLARAGWLGDARAGWSLLVAVLVAGSRVIASSWDVARSSGETGEPRA